MGRVTALDPLIQNLKSTTFCGRRLTRRQIADIQEVVRTFPQLSRNELGQTVCEHLLLFFRLFRKVNPTLFLRLKRRFFK